ncbi:unnamed protein product [Taenia asiatica]|uniref:Fibronectin type-III domain-containing protein n=1 Tax=Taenia asiatica TaxID=60517 RepID=A0A0R3VX17_TAEAS|nr:unnamed protein product [Taenia asiatica]
MPEAEWFVANLRWYYMKPGKLLLTWDVRELVDRDVDEIRVRATTTSGVRRMKKAGASVKDGNVTLEKLLRNTSYLMNVEGYANETLIFGSISLIKTRPSAPSRIQRPEGEALSPTRIQLRWSRPTRPNGILNPYRVTCFDATKGSTPVNATTNNSTTSVIVNNLKPETVYKCSVSTTAARRVLDPAPPTDLTSHHVFCGVALQPPHTYMGISMSTEYRGQFHHPTAIRDEEKFSNNMAKVNAFEEREDQ